MSRSRLGVVSLCAVALGLMVVSASTAQASQWLILNAKKEVRTGATLPALLAAGFEEKTDGTLLATILNIKTEILCLGFTFNGFDLEGGGNLSNGGKAKFTGCGVILNGTFNGECEAHSTGSPVGTIETLELKGQLKLIGAAGLTKIEPLTGTTFVTILMGPGCPIGNKVPISGVLTVEDCEGLLETHLIKHLIKENAANTTLTALGNKATLDGSAWVFLSGEHAGLAWGGDKE